MAENLREYDRLQTALQLVADAYEVLGAQEYSRVDIADWLRSAQKLLDEFGMVPFPSHQRAVDVEPDPRD
jgi:hypothetical protein